MSALLPLLIALVLPATAAPQKGSSWRLVGAYDASAVLAAVEASRDPEVRAAEPPPPPFNWAPPSALGEFCGHPRAPTGLGVMEAVAISTGITPTLALVLRTPERQTAPLRESDVSVSVLLSPESTSTADQAFLRPAVESRRLRIQVDDRTQTSDDRRNATKWSEVVRTQLGIQLCLEHMLGRAWSGGDELRIREAFLLAQPAPMTDADRRYLVGQRDPVAAYLGPPDACEVAGGRTPRASDEASAELVPADVWEGRLRPCPAGPSTTWPPAPSLPLRLSGGGYQERKSDDGWTDVDVILRDGVTPVPTVEVRLEGESLGDPTLLMPAVSGDMAGGTGTGQMEDLLGRIPLHYPMVRQGGHWYTVLLVPEWQLAEAIHRRSERMANPVRGMDQPAPGRPRDPRNAVEWVLQHPELLRLQVRPLDDRVEGAAMWPDLAVAMQSGFLGARDWGYTVGMAAGRSSVALPTSGEVAWDHAHLAQRGQVQSFLTAAMAGLFLAMVLGLRRLSELWRPIPEERADYWPAVGKDDQADGTPDGPSGMISTGGVE